MESGTHAARSMNLSVKNYNYYYVKSEAHNETPAGINKVYLDIAAIDMV